MPDPHEHPPRGEDVLPVEPRDELGSRLAYLDLDSADVERLRRLVPHFEGFAAEFVERFYEHLLAFPQTARFLQDEQLVERLKRMQREHFESLLSAEWDAAYVERRRRVGQVHAEVGIDPAMFLGAYNQYVQQYGKQVIEPSDPKTRAQLEEMLSVMKVVFLDIGLTLDAYFDQLTQRIRRALDLYWRANAELKQFAKLASHDLKTPLATVANLCDEAVDEFGAQMPAGAVELVTAARDRTFRMSRLIDELLASAESAESTEELAEVVPRPLFQEAVERLDYVLRKKQIAVQIAEPLPILKGNRIRLREAFYNLLSNGAKFIDKSPGRIDVTCERRGENAVFCIADNGCGIPADELNRIFVPFRRLPTRESQPGSGLGLYFTKSIIEDHGGKVWAESRPGEGSKFFIRLPMVTD